MSHLDIVETTAVCIKSDMGPQQNKRANIRLVIFSAVLACAMLAFDLSTPLGVAGGLPYVALVLMGSWFPRKRHVFFLATVATFLTVVGYLQSPAGGVEWMVMTNRFLALSVIWVTAVLVAKRKQTEQHLIDLNENLETLVEERTRDVYRSEQHFRAVAETAQDAIVMVDAAGAITQWNDAASRIFGYSADEIIGQPILTIIPERYRDAHNAGFDYMISGDERRLASGVLELAAIRKDGEELPIELSLSMWEEDGQRVFTSIIRDIAKRKQDEKEIHRALQRAEIANRAKTELLSNMSHELRTPLNAVIGFSETIQEEIFGPLEHQRYREYIDNISSSGQQLLELINDILDVSALESDSLKLGEENLDVAKLVDGAMSSISERARQSDVQIETTVDADVSRIFADGQRVKQILVNLLSNAVKFTHPGGSVRMRVFISDDGSLTFTIADTGIGMDAKELEQAMAHFGQVGRGRTFKHEGTGLGVPLTKSLVELHGGTFSIESEKGVGTTVTVMFPKSRAIKAA